MDTRRVEVVWNYLPAFMAVAETEHLRKAALKMRVSPSSLSRMIGLLEYHLGYVVFSRCGRRIQLNPAGHKLMDAVRHSMVLVDDVVTRGARP